MLKFSNDYFRTNEYGTYTLATLDYQKSRVVTEVLHMRHCGHINSLIVNEVLKKKIHDSIPSVRNEASYVRSSQRDGKNTSLSR